MNWQPISSIRIRNYKAITDTGRLRLKPFNLLIGNNGSGKSSLIEALELLRSIGTEPLDEVFVGPRSVEHVLHKGTKSGRLSPEIMITKESERLKILASGSNYYADASSRAQPSLYNLSLEVAAVAGESEGVKICKETLEYIGKRRLVRDADGLVTKRVTGDTEYRPDGRLAENEALIRSESGRFFAPWQVLGLVPEHMGLPAPRQINALSRSMARDGSDIAEAFFRLSTEHPDILQSIVETMRVILGYAERVDPRQDRGAIISRYIELDESSYTIPGWMLSTGTLRILALLIALRRPQPPSLLCIEEIENGLDPRTLSLLIDEIIYRTNNKELQVIVTTHSPYLLDKIDLDQIILVDRKNGSANFSIPSTSDKVRAFAKNFDPGHLYTMGVLQGPL